MYVCISCDLVQVNITLVLCVVCVSLLNTDSLAQYSHCIDIFDVAGFTLKLSFLTQLGFPYVHTSIKATCKKIPLWCCSHLNPCFVVDEISKNHVQSSNGATKNEPITTVQDHCSFDVNFHDETVKNAVIGLSIKQFGWLQNGLPSSKNQESTSSLLAKIGL